MTSATNFAEDKRQNAEFNANGNICSRLKGRVEMAELAKRSINQYNLVKNKN